jgi:hypothetical protein
MLENLYCRLEIIMFFEILTYLPEKRLAMFVKMTDEDTPRGIIDKCLQENSQTQKKSLTTPLPNFGIFMRV